MSADSPNPTRPHMNPGSPRTVTPQTVTDPTILDSVAGFISDVVPTNYNEIYDSKDQIQWARFEQMDCDESNCAPIFGCDKIVPVPLVLILGYTTGIQVWAIPANGEASEIFSWRHGSVKVLKILPTPYIVGSGNYDHFLSKRPLIALCDSSITGSTNNSLNFYSLKTGEQVKMIKFKSPIIDILANKRSLVVTFSERIAVFDAFSLEDRMSVTTCYLSPGLNPNPVALGPRWLAYSEKKINQSKRSSGGNEGEGVQSYTATMLHAAKSLGRGLRELGESVANSLTGTPNYKPGTSPNSPQAGGQLDVPQKGIVTILDIEAQPAQNGEKVQIDSIIAHFIAHTEAIVALEFDPCGLLLLTADKRGHDFHLFRIHPHPSGPVLAAVHHLYTLHRGDTSAKVQDMCFSFDSRWATISTLRGTTHVFPITPYGGNISVRTHASPHVVNKISRFHRSAGLTDEGRSNSPVSMFEFPINSHLPFHNPRFPPFPHPTVVHPLAQIRQPVYIQNISVTPRQGRQRLSSSSEDNIALRVVASFAMPRAWIDPLQATRETIKSQPKPVESLFIMSCHGTLVQYDLDPRHASNIPKERVCDDTPIELSVTAKAQWVLQRPPDSFDSPLPLSQSNLILIAQNVPLNKRNKLEHNDDDWLSQVEIVTHAGPHRRLWMGPQFTFKTYTTANGSPLSVSDAQPIDLSRSKPVNMPITKANAILIESSSASSCEQSLLETYQKNCEEIGSVGEHQIKEDLADAMMESPGIRETGGKCVIISMTPRAPTIEKVVNPLGTVNTVHSDDEKDPVVPEDAVIHENCDETLFRPMVATRAIVYQNSKQNKSFSGNIMTKSLEGNTEVAVKVLKKIDTHISEPLNKNIQQEQLTASRTEKKTKLSAKKKTFQTLDHNKHKLNFPSSTKENLETSNVICPLTDKTTKKIDKKEIHFPCKKDKGDIENEYLLSLCMPKDDKSEDAQDSGLPLPVKAIDYKMVGLQNVNKDVSTLENSTSNSEKLKETYQDIDVSSDATTTSEDNTTEEKSVARKNRKPKTKLGIKISNLTKENDVEEAAEVKFKLPRRTWSNVAAAKKEVDIESDISTTITEYIENLNIQVPDVCVDEHLIDIDTPIEKTAQDNLKVEKSSDDEKGDTGSSPIETTESDDSGKLPVEELEESTTKIIPTSKSAKKRLKKKKK